MKPFLKIVAEKLHDRFGTTLHQVAVVFPNRRQSIFFKDYLSKIIIPPAFLPELLTIEELVQRSAYFPIAPPIVQSFILYEAYTEVIQSAKDITPLDYEKFYPIGEILTRDFEDLDAYLCDISVVYKQLKDIENIEKSFSFLSDEQQQFLKRFWSTFSTERKSLQQEKFLSLWEILPEVYQLFHKKLSEKQLISKGLAYRNLANNEFSRKKFSNDWQHIAFVGFNAFNKSEEVLLQRWQKENKASLWMDVDEHYIKNVQHEAGHFIRRNIETLGLKNELEVSNAINTTQKKIDVIATEGNAIQAKLLAQWLKQPEIIENTASAAIILADEKLLLPVLQSIPDEISQVNVTMGYPLQQTVLYSLIQLFFEIQKDLQVHNEYDISYIQVQAFLQHALCDWNDKVRQELQQKIIDEVMHRVPLNKLQGYSSIGNYIFTPLEQPLQIFERLLSILEALQQVKNFGNDLLLQGMLVQLWQTIQQLKQLFSILPAQHISLSFITQTLRKQFSSIIVPFEGEPLKGIQIMGLLESRGLDFDHIIILNANEGILPRIHLPTSFLPDSIRRAYGLSVPEHQDAIFAYAFYRLLHRSNHINLIYNSTITDSSTGEVTRFLPQLEFETNISIEKKQVSFPVKSNSVGPLIIEKTPEIVKQLSSYFAGNKLSPSAINTYLNCRLQFYFRYIAKLKEPDEIQEEVDAMVFGNIVHKLMQLLYEALRNKNAHWKITAEDIDWMKNQVPVLLPQAFKQGWQEKNKKSISFSGKLKVIAEVVSQYANAYLDYDRKHTPFEIESLEESFKEMFNININGKSQSISLGGYIDRIDIVNNIYRMVDYKTGGDEMVFSTVEKLFDRDTTKRNKAALQTLIYAWIFNKKFPDRKQFAPALLPLRAMLQKGDAFNPYFISKVNRIQQDIIDSNNIHSTLMELEIHLKKILEELFDSNTPFTQTEDINQCSVCAYAIICQRNKFSKS